MKKLRKSEARVFSDIGVKVNRKLHSHFNIKIWYNTNYLLHLTNLQLVVQQSWLNAQSRLPKTILINLSKHDRQRHNKIKLKCDSRNATQLASASNINQLIEARKVMKSLCILLKKWPAGQAYAQSRYPFAKAKDFTY